MYDVVFPIFYCYAVSKVMHHAPAFQSALRRVWPGVRCGHALLMNENEALANNSGDGSGPPSASFFCNYFVSRSLSLLFFRRNSSSPGVHPPLSKMIQIRRRARSPKNGLSLRTTPLWRYITEVFFCHFFFCPNGITTQTPTVAAL